jgi:peptide/nickel transport system permease protein
MTMTAATGTQTFPSSVDALQRHVRSRSQFRLVLGQLRRNRSAMLGGTVVVLLILVAFLSPWLTPYDPIDTAPKLRLQGPSWSHPMGTDKLGRDVLSRVIAGTPYSLRTGVIAVGISAAIGVVLGLIAGYYRGPLGTAIVMAMDAMLAFPSILLALSIVAALGPGLTNTMIAVGISWIPYFVRLVRATVLSARNNVYVDAARVVGCSDRRILVVHILPNVLAPVIVLCTLGVASAILVGASLSFLGLGAQPPTPEWGAMLNDGRSILRLAPWVTTFPGLAIMVTVLAMNLLGDGLRDALDPRMKL